MQLCDFVQPNPNQTYSLPFDILYICCVYLLLHTTQLEYYVSIMNQAMYFVSNNQIIQQSPQIYLYFNPNVLKRTQSVHPSFYGLHVTTNQLNNFLSN